MELLESGGCRGCGSASWWLEGRRVVVENVLWWRGSSESSELESEVMEEVEEAEAVLGLRGRG